MKKTYHIFILISLYSSFVFGQNISLLRKELIISKHDTDKVFLLNKLGNYYKSNNYDSAKYFFNESFKLSKKLSFNKGIERYYFNIHSVLMESGKYDSSLIIMKEGLKLAEKSKDKKRMALCYQNISSSFHYLIKFDSCAKYDLKAQEILEALNDKKELVVFYGNLCGSYSEQHKFKKSEEYGLKALRLSQQGYGDENDLVYVLVNLASTYIYLNDNEKASFYGQKCATIAKRIKNFSVLQVVLENLMFVKISQKKYKDLFPIVDQLKDLGKEFTSDEYKARLNFNYSMAYFYNGKTLLAKEFAIKTLAISEPNKFSVLSKNSYTLLDKIEAILGNFEMSEIYGSKRDSISNEQINVETTKNIQELEKKYETQKKEIEILKLNKESGAKTRMLKIAIGSILALLTFVFLGYRNFKNHQKIAEQTEEIQTQKIAELEKDKQLLAVDALLRGQEEERNRIAKDLHDGLGGMLSGVKMSFVNIQENLIMDAENVKSFEKSILQLDSTIAELRKVAHNLMPEALAKFGLKDAIKDFCNAMESSSHVKIIYQFFGEERSIGNTAEVYIYRIIQELVSNAIKHAEPTQIVVQMTVAEKNILLTIEDNGIGIDSSKKRNSSGIGLKSVQQRVDYLNGKLDFENNEPTGTVVNIELNA